MTEQIKFSALNEIDFALYESYLLLRQNGTDYKVSKATLLESLVHLTSLRTVPKFLGQLAIFNDEFYVGIALTGSEMWYQITVNSDPDFNIAGEQVDLGSVVINYDNKVYLADKDTLSHVNKVIGLTKSSAIIDANVQVQLDRDITNDNWELIPNDIYYLGNAGQLTNIVPSTGFILPIGFALTSTTLKIKMGIPIIL